MVMITTERPASLPTEAQTRSPQPTKPMPSRTSRVNWADKAKVNITVGIAEKKFDATDSTSQAAALEKGRVNFSPSGWMLTIDTNTMTLTLKKTPTSEGQGSPAPTFPSSSTVPPTNYSTDFNISTNLKPEIGGEGISIKLPEKSILEFHMSTNVTVEQPKRAAIPAAKSTPELPTTPPLDDLKSEFFETILAQSTASLTSSTSNPKAGPGHIKSNKPPTTGNPKTNVRSNPAPASILPHASTTSAQLTTNSSQSTNSTPSTSLNVATTSNSASDSSTRTSTEGGCVVS